MTVRMLNRAALIVKPKQPYVDWVNSLDDQGPKLNLGDQDEEHTIYLIEEVDSLSDKSAVLKPYFKAIFEDELMGWHRLERDWPSNRDLATFLDWFDVEVHSMVIDLGHKHLKTERFDL